MGKQLARRSQIRSTLQKIAGEFMRTDLNVRNLTYFIAAALFFGIAITNPGFAEELFIEPIFAPERTDSNRIYRADALRIDGTNTVLRYDVYRPTKIAGGPAVPETLPGMVLIHGGGFRMGNKNLPNIVEVAEYFASRGYVVATINYRLIDETNPMLDPAVESGPLPVSPPVDTEAYIEWANNLDNEQERIFNAANAAHNDASRFVNFAVNTGIWPDVDSSRIVSTGSSAGAITSAIDRLLGSPQWPECGLGWRDQHGRWNVWNRINHRC